MNDHTTLPRSVVEQAIEATGVLLRMIRRDAPYLSGKTMGIAETCNDALLGALAGAAQAEPMAWIRKPEAPTFYAPVLHLDSNPPTPLTKQEAIIAGWVPVVECTAPQPAQPVPVLEPLTDAEIAEPFKPFRTSASRAFIEGVRFAEAAHAAKLAKRGGV